MKPEQAAALRAPFPKSAIGYQDRGSGPRLAYVGHAATTARLLEVDSEWSWEPLSVDERGLPAFDHLGGLWIRLTVCGVSRIGYGDAQGKKGPNAVKEAIGDAIRNAAMRFGVALDLWAKEDISATLPPSNVDAHTGEVHQPPAGGAETASPAGDPYAGTRTHGEPITDAQQRKLGALLKGQTRDQALAIVATILGRDVESRNDLSKRDAMRVIDELEKQAALNG